MQDPLNRNNTEQYEEARELARKKRQEFGIRTADIDLPVLKKICKQEGVKVDMVKEVGARIRAAYFFDEDGCSILLKKDLPREPKMFALVHELKHHFLDRQLIADGKMQCGDYNANRTTEIAAEEFAAEFLYPAEEMKQLLASRPLKASQITPEEIVEIKRLLPIHVSYAFIRKRMERFNLLSKNQFAEVQFQKLEDRLYPPFYKQPWFKRARLRS
jgi:Zn-dependent peptidase ImmA (M78 family)